MLTPDPESPVSGREQGVAFLAMLELLARDGHTWIRPEDDEAAEMIERVAARDVTEEDFAAWVAEHVDWLLPSLY